MKRMLDNNPGAIPSDRDDPWRALPSTFRSTSTLCTKRPSRGPLRAPRNNGVQRTACESFSAEDGLLRSNLARGRNSRFAAGRRGQLTRLLPSLCRAFRPSRRRCGRMACNQHDVAADDLVRARPADSSPPNLAGNPLKWICDLPTEISDPAARVHEADADNNPGAIPSDRDDPWRSHCSHSGCERSAADGCCRFPRRRPLRSNS